MIAVLPWLELVVGLLAGVVIILLAARLEAAHRMIRGLTATITEERGQRGRFDARISDDERCRLIIGNPIATPAPEDIRLRVM